jgi:hypothetical protein
MKTPGRKSPVGRPWRDNNIKMVLVDHGGLMVGVLATDPKLRGYKHGRRRRIFEGDKNP